MFLVVYGLLVSLDETRPVMVDKVMSAVLLSAALLAGVALVTVIVYTIAKGWNALFRWNLYTQDMSAAGPADPITVGGIGHAIVGTLIILGIAIAITVPLGLSTAVFLNEINNRFSRFVRTVVDAMTALPSILAGLFIFATWILILGFERSGLAAAIAVSIMMLPIIIRSADVVLRLVPGNLKEASYALGAEQNRTVRIVTLPDRPVGPGHRRDPRHRPWHRRDRTGAADRGLHGHAQRRPAAQLDGLAVAVDLLLREVAPAGAHPAWLRHRRRADGARAGAVRHRPRARRSPGRPAEQPAGQAGPGPFEA